MPEFTQREYIAIQLFQVAMQGRELRTTPDKIFREIAEASIVAADILLEELVKSSDRAKS